MTAVESSGPSLRERIDFLLTDGRECTPAEIARLLRASHEAVKKAARAMARDGELSTRGDGWYFATDVTRRKLAARRVRRGPKPRSVTPLVERHLVHMRKRGLRPQTITQRRWVLARLEAWLHSQGVELLDATPEHLEQFCDFTHGQSGHKTAVRNVTGFYRWLVEREELLPVNPARRLVLPRVRPGLPRPISEPRLAEALERAPEPVRTWLVLAGWCGLRAMEIAPLHTNDVDFVARALLVRDGKGGLPRVQPLPAIATEALRAHVGRGYLFGRIDPPAGPISANDLSHRANRYLRSIEIPDTFHALRHRYATQVYEQSGFDLLATQTLLGHRSIVSTTVYARARPSDELHHVVAQLPT